MTRTAAAVAVAILLATTPFAYAAETSSTVGMRHTSAEDLKSLTDMRVGIVKAALQLTAEQEKYWPALEEAMRARAGNRQARLEQVAALQGNDTTAAAGQSNPVEFMQRRADMLIQRGTDLKKVADAWAPLYKTLTDDQKRRMAFVSFVALRGMRDAIDHMADSEEDDN
ncbi:Spy/CpxP family protein refolding chaperone [Bradyrhizobium tropiciagri]|uniref:Spy/CpxP family protein refolding chaperone n=1 Tax=Bradyrhizobium tropiciagri TaxID=312253 RepID=UPI001BA483B4|nr:Spy/CpxP family protein refolding chaperone [Bradyrhizobium tropiciagri]MBR0869354.1 Spy/CpxP family protein refolding chaperone [Bradyrhizobium tropiciagri]